MRECSKDGKILRSALHLSPDYTYLWRQRSALAMFPIAKWHVLAKPSGHLRMGWSFRTFSYIAKYLYCKSGPTDVPLLLGLRKGHCKLGHGLPVWVGLFYTCASVNRTANSNVKSPLSCHTKSGTTTTKNKHFLLHSQKWHKIRLCFKMNLVVKETL